MPNKHSPNSIVAIVPAAGVGSRMKVDRPKQYLTINDTAILEHTVLKLLSHPKIDTVVVSVTDGDPYFSSLSIANQSNVIRVSGGKERADSVLSALEYLNQENVSEWVLVHDAARPCVQLKDIDRLIETALAHEVGAILACPVRDTMKRSDSTNNIDSTVERNNLWHALTPQMFRTSSLYHALNDALKAEATITDEASAMERLGLAPALVHGRSDNIKITQPEDLSLAEFYLSHNKEKESCE
ncbi:2-C-methyl-D-erythritol 4-phosphate cytidylyltransferase [Vibrio genomosp. F10]|uniref:2-C-methyl-D-erythritol 4-phosphate cytidylyltransferase n=2 Tax=Vibrio genomosp. F10 TaxID=723171 RepID=A0A1B9QWS7_9VIBR|nr:2-C-methyl-D-erythritol 4-phosphate cytidylyltransferase [Vibrio genomosp. F10]OCH74145.1 2-C-methyl-D-erythritol 4-phosphate cytidylyltransferase [Vibrio genomosp. F10]OEE33573.1 2-C-methyl-D-erythritol 4-phosphate cytidylyltransferase [Vibrio genomosp. F10 str. ZF-129]OEE94751.1 2-C-methyl-D-erythritol 4-phosphate cytidylyltransferase [Vibrio genomosp. F10 str. 9ZC157]OEE95379.1 2-C-methyl-D-erythritol 4-phosphate cytidylyltransferase [Vibrio genomosp. F10 str. 9ZD137]OEF08098.1 2-C-methy